MDRKIVHSSSEKTGNADTSPVVNSKQNNAVNMFGMLLDCQGAGTSIAFPAAYADEVGLASSNIDINR